MKIHLKKERGGNNDYLISIFFSKIIMYSAVTDGDGMGTVGCFYELTIKRPNGYTWKLELSNNLFSNFTTDF